MAAASVLLLQQVATVSSLGVVGTAAFRKTVALLQRNGRPWPPALVRTCPGACICQKRFKMRRPFSQNEATNSIQQVLQSLFAGAGTQGWPYPLR